MSREIMPGWQGLRVRPRRDPNAVRRTPPESTGEAAAGREAGTGAASEVAWAPPQGTLMVPPWGGGPDAGRCAGTAAGTTPHPAAARSIPGPTPTRNAPSALPPIPPAPRLLPAPIPPRGPVSTAGVPPQTTPAGATPVPALSIRRTSVDQRPVPAAPVPAAPPTTPLSAAPVPATVVPAATDLLSLDLDEPVRGDPPGTELGPARRGLRRLGLAAVAVASLGVGVLGGSGYAQQTARTQRDAETAVMLWADSADVPGEAEPGAPAVLRVTLAVTGAPVVVDRVLLGAGEGDSPNGVALVPGRPVPADLVVHADCSTVSRDAAGLVTRPGNLRAVIHRDGSSRHREVPLNVLADPSAVMLSLLAPCMAATEQATAEETTADADAANDVSAVGALAPGSGGRPSAGAPPALLVSGLTAHSNGRLTFAVRSRGTATSRFTMPVASIAGSRARFQVRSRPALPVTVRPGATVRVTVDVRASCHDHPGTLPMTYGLLLPQAETAAGAGGRTAAGAARRSVPLEGWDDGVAAAALTAAVLRGCR
ncbi:MAG TPA: hypothetical protein VI248_02540 [Kineosporiaceae bacterium]